MTKILNTDQPLDRSAIDRLTNLDTRIWRRAELLPPSLAMHDNDMSDLAVNTYGLHIQFLGIRIVLHRLLSRAISQNAEPMRTGSLPSPYEDSMERSRTIMHDNAIRIARLASTYQQIFGIENVITIMLDNMYVAAALLISHANRLRLLGSSVSIEQDVHWVRSLAEMFKNAQVHYPVTARIRLTLANLVEKTPMAGIFSLSAHESNRLSADRSLDVENEEVAGGTGSMAFDDRQEGPMLGGEFAEYLIPQDLDMNSMMSWVLSPLE